MTVQQILGWDITEILEWVRITQKFLWNVFWKILKLLTFQKLCDLFNQTFTKFQAISGAMEILANVHLLYLASLFPPFN